MTNMTWKTFRQVAYRRLGLDTAHARLAYRLYVDGYSEPGALTGLVNENGWHKLIDDIGEEFTYSNDVELEILDVNNAVSSTVILLQEILQLQYTQRPKGNAKNSGHVWHNSIGPRARHSLSSRAPDVETYAFFYPSVLFDLPEGYEGVTSEEIEIIRGAGVQNADDFTFLSPLNLCLTTGIAPGKIVALYCWADEMIAGVHKEQKETIVELKALRNALK